MKHIFISMVFIVCHYAALTVGFLKGPKAFVPRTGSRCTGIVEQTSGNGCIDCSCEDGLLKCYKAECPKLTLPENPDCKLVYLPGQCCPSYECPTVTSFVSVSSPNDPRCRSTDPCKKCSCVDGLSKCDSYECLEATVNKPNCKRVPKEDKCCPDYYCPISKNEISSNISQLSCANVKCYMPHIPPSCKLTVQPGKCCPQVDCSTTAPPGENFNKGVEPTDTESSGGRCKGKGRIPSSSICNICFCSSGQKKCTKVECPDEKVPEGCKRTKVSGECCPRLQCDNEEVSGDEESNDIKMCTVDGPIKSTNPCSKCACKNGWKFCSRTACENKVLLTGCKLVNVENKCCPEVSCDELEVSTTENTDYDDISHPRCTGTGPIPSTDPCNQCSCWKGARLCPSFNCPRLVKDGCKLERVPDKCCPIEVCDDDIGKSSRSDDLIDDEIPEVKIDPNDPFRCIGEGPIPSPNPCSKCTCKKNTIICARISCNTAKPVGSRCTEVTVPGQCCKVLECTKKG